MKERSLDEVILKFGVPVVVGALLLFGVYQWLGKTTKTEPVSDPQAKHAEKATDREALIASVITLSQQLDKRWRANVGTVQAVGKQPDVPPMLYIVESEMHVQVFNVGFEPACVQLNRVRRNSAKPNDYMRCRLGHESCQQIPQNGSVNFQLFATGNAEACMYSPLEFRVGGPTVAGPSWWSRSALEDFDQRPALTPEDFARRPDADLETERARLQRLLAEFTSR